MSNYLIWDFDGTLGYRDGIWSGALLQVLRQADPACDLTIDHLRPHLRTGFPWDSHDRAWGQRTPDEWWDGVQPLFERAFAAVQVEPDQCRVLARRVREVYLAPDAWRLFDDTVSTLTTLSTAGWTHVVLSNHVPELGTIIDRLGLAPHLAQIFNSALIGYEKPHPAAFQTVLNALPNRETVWMIGDNIVADVQGAEAVGLPAILVRRSHPDARYAAPDLTTVPSLLSPN